jgi:hypothetical protein
MTPLLLSLVAAAFMAGVGWLVSVVQYPLFALVGGDAWPAYHEAHRRRITWVVLPAMVVELGGAAWVAWSPPPGADPGLAWAGLALAAGSWLLTILVAVPDHERLARAYDPGVGVRLTRLHHLRTACWTGHAVVAGLLVAAA